MPEHGSRDLPAIQGVAQSMTAHPQWQLIYILRIQIVPDVVVARAIIAGQAPWQRRKNSSRRKRKESSVRDCIYAAAPGVVDLSLQAMTEPFHCGQLKAVVVTVGAGGELRHSAESWIGRLHGERSKTTLAHRLIAIHLRQIGLIHGTRADVLCLRTGGRSELMFNSQAPLHEVGRMQLAVRHCCHRDWWKTSRGICLWR